MKLCLHWYRTKREPMPFWRTWIPKDSMKATRARPANIGLKGYLIKVMFMVLPSKRLVFKHIRAVGLVSERARGNFEPLCLQHVPWIFVSGVNDRASEYQRVIALPINAPQKQAYAAFDFCGSEHLLLATCTYSTDRELARAATNSLIHSYSRVLAKP
jgi:hypothetical protein